MPAFAYQVLYTTQVFDAVAPPVRRGCQSALLTPMIGLFASYVPSGFRLWHYGATGKRKSSGCNFFLT